MFTKLEQRFWTKIEVARCRCTQEYFQGLREACDDAVLPYRTVARWVKTIREGRDAVQDNLRTGLPYVENNIVQLLASLLDADRRLTAIKLTVEDGVCRTTVFHILHILGYRKLTARWIPHQIFEVQQCHCYVVAQALLDRYQREGDVSLARIVPNGETWAHSNESNLKRQSNEGFSSKESVPTQCAVKMFIVTYD